MNNSYFIIISFSDKIKNFLRDNSYICVMQFFVSFLSIQLYVFFFHVITKLAKWKRVLAAFWTVSYRSTHKYIDLFLNFSIFQFQMNTISVMKTAREGKAVFLLFATCLTILMMIVSKAYGEISSKHKRGLFVSH